MDHFPGSGGWREVCGQKFCYHVAAFCDSLQFDMQYAHVLKKLNFDLLTPFPRTVAGLFGKTFATMLLHFVILLI